jgi:hypothetical protein
MVPGGRLHRGQRRLVAEVTCSRGHVQQRSRAAAATPTGYIDTNRQGGCTCAAGVSSSCDGLRSGAAPRARAEPPCKVLGGDVGERWEEGEEWP